jgi:hypothetical protein
MNTIKESTETVIDSSKWGWSGIKSSEIKLYVDSHQSARQSHPYLFQQ